MAFELRKAGVSYEKIAERVGYKNANTAANAVSRTLKRSRKHVDTDDMVNMELSRLDALQAVAWRRAKEGDLPAIDRILKIMERRAHYLGLDTQQPQQDIHQTTVVIGGNQSQYIESLKAVRQEINQNNQSGSQ
jgi:hypothetical protein